MGDKSSYMGIYQLRVGLGRGPWMWLLMMQGPLSNRGNTAEKDTQSWRKERWKEKASSHSSS